VKDRYSTVRVTLNSDGSVRQLHVSRRSGLDFLDDEAVRSVREAAPFHNPPEGLKDQDGLIHFTFGFYLEITNEPNFRIFR
jgi:TonB family protein